MIVLVLGSQDERDAIDSLGISTSSIDIVVVPPSDVMAMDIDLSNEYVFSYQLDAKALRKHWSYILDTPVPPLKVSSIRWPMLKMSFGVTANSISSLCSELLKQPPDRRKKLFDQIFVKGGSFGAYDTRIPIRSQDAAKFVDAISMAMRCMNNLFVRSGKICVLDSSGSGVTALDEPGLTSLLSRHIRFVRDDGSESLPPTRLVRAIQPHVLAGVGEIISIANRPLVSSSGEIVAGRGYHRDYRVYTTHDKVSMSLMSRDEAAKFICDEMRDYLSDFPLKSDADYATWVSFVLSHFFVHTEPICYPMTIVEANTAGAGKTLLVKLASVICHGKVVPPLPLSSQEEIRKCLLAFIGQCRETLWFDNVVGRLGCPTLDAILTSPCWSDRVLGSSQIVSCDLRIIPVATANNATIGHDLVRRAVRCRLVSEHETPETRGGFRYPDIIDFIAQKREYLVDKFISVLYSYIYNLLRGDAAPGTLLGSFEVWSRYVSGCVEWCGLPSPITTQAELRAEADSSRSALAELLVLWNVVLDPSGKGITPGEIDLALKLAPSEAGWQTLLTAMEELCEGAVTPAKIGVVLRKYKEKVVNGRRLVRREQNGRILWFVEPR